MYRANFRGDVLKISFKYTTLSVIGINQHPGRLVDPVLSSLATSESEDCAQSCCLDWPELLLDRRFPYQKLFLEKVMQLIPHREINLGETAGRPEEIDGNSLGRS